MFINDKEYNFLTKFSPLLGNTCADTRFLPRGAGDKSWEKTVFLKYAPFIGIFGLGCLTCHENDPYEDRFLIRADSSERTYFLPGSAGYKSIKRENLIVFESGAEAESAGFRKK
ncbi:MAG: hypothetical protein JW728_03350 [Candidatus Aureabacteria bacterium]|nr:hypothetical protein [Candidatus Auribacterota bacterium]